MRNILITYLSTLPRQNNTVSYKSKLGTIEAPYTNEAGIKYLAGYLKPEGRTLDMVIAVCSGDVKTKAAASFENKKAIDYFKEKLAESFPECVPRTVDTNGRIEGKNDVGKVFNALDDITSEDRLFLDITGGFRDSAYTLSLVGRFLEFKNVCIEMVIYSLLNNNDRTIGKVTNYTPDYRLIDLVNGMNEFVNFGSAQTINKFFKATDNEKIRMLTTAMQGFSETISLGKTGSIDKRIESLKKGIEAVENGTDENIEFLILKDMLPVIRQKLFAGGDSMDYISLISWCADNRMVQQGLTLFVEKIPEYLFTKELIIADAERIAKANKDKQDHETIYTWMLYTDMLADKSINSELRELLGRINGAKDKRERLKIKKELPKGSELYNAVGAHLDIIERINERRTYYSGGNKITLTPLAKKAWDVLNGNYSTVLHNNFSNDYLNALLGVNNGNKSGTDTKGNEKFEKKLDNFRKLQRGTDTRGYSFGAEREKVIKIIAIYLYIKQVRNEVNHASDNENLSGAQVEYFAKFGLKYEMTLDSLAEDIRTGIKSIRDAERERKM